MEWVTKLFFMKKVFLQLFTLNHTKGKKAIKHSENWVINFASFSVSLMVWINTCQWIMNKLNFKWHFIVSLSPTRMPPRLFVLLWCWWWHFCVSFSPTIAQCHRKAFTAFSMIIVKRSHSSRNGIKCQKNNFHSPTKLY